MKEKGNSFLGAILGAFAMYGIYKFATHPKVKEEAKRVYSKMSKKVNTTVDYVSEEDADINCKTKDAFVDVTPPSEEA